MKKQHHITRKHITAFALVLALLFSMVPAPASYAAKKVKLSSKTLKIKAGKSKKLKLKNNKKKVKWKVTSGKKNIKLKGKSKKGVTIKAVKKGKATVQAQIGKKKYKCKVTVLAKNDNDSSDDDVDFDGFDDDPDSSADPSATPDGTANPDGTSNPEGSSAPEGSSNPEKTTTPEKTSSPEESTKPEETSAPTETPVVTETPAPTTGSTTRVPGKEIDLEGRTPFTIGSYKIALGISKDKVLEALGSDATEVTAKSPQGYNVIKYNPEGTYDGYTLIYLDEGVVVNICTIASADKASYGDLVKTGVKADTLSGWSAVDWYAAKDGEAKEGNGAYRYTDSASGATILAFADYFNTNQTTGNTVYCIQVYSSTIDFDDMTKPAKCTYGDDVLAEMETQTAELLRAYRVFLNYPAGSYASGQILPLKEEAGLKTVASDWLSKCAISDTPPAEQGKEKLKAAIIAENQKQGQDATMYYAQITMAGNADSIGFANSVLEKKESHAYIRTIKYTEYDAVPVFNYCYQYLGVAAAGIDKNAAAMVIDLVDRWYDNDPVWYDEAPSWKD